MMWVWDKSDNQLEFGDNAKLSFGGSSDMQLYHDSNNSYIDDSGNGSLFLQSSGTGIYFQVIGGSNRMADFNVGGDVKLYHNANPKLRTTNTGAVVTGICTATSFSGSGEGLTRTTPLSHRNRIINGDMQISQRYGTTETTLNNAAYHWVLDRFPFYESTNGTATVTQVTSGYAASHTGSGKSHEN